MKAEDLLAKRAKRVASNILHAKEKGVDQLLRDVPGGREASQRLRAAILKEINSLSDLAVDMATEAEEFWLDEARLDELVNLVASKLEARSEEVDDGTTGEPAR